ncbi:MAG: hypothetical protein AAB545_00370 [Patescibacteria group bacterium]
MPKFIEIMFILVGAMLVTTHVMADTSAVGSDGITYRVPPKLYGEVYLQNGETRITKEENCNFKKTSLFLQKKICSDSEKVMRKGDDITMESTGPSETLVYRFDVIGVVAGMTFMAIAIVLFRLLKKLAMIIYANTVVFAMITLFVVIATFPSSIPLLLLPLTIALVFSRERMFYIIAIVYEVLMGVLLFQIA